MQRGAAQQRNNNMNQKQLAEHYGISKAAVCRWSEAKRHRKTVEAYAGVDTTEQALTAEIARLAAVYAGQQFIGDVCTKQVILSISGNLRVSIYNLVESTAKPERVFESHGSVELLHNIKAEMEQLVYGAQKSVSE
jgi:hypothetical protein